MATLELKNPFTDQTVRGARHQYQQRDPREPLFAFRRRSLVHFAVDTEAVLMTTRLAGSATHFLPFDRGEAGGAGNPPEPLGWNYRTAYLWEEVLARDSLLDLLARFIHLRSDERRDEQGRKVKRESLIFPRYHQFQAVRQPVAAARDHGVGHNHLIERAYCLFAGPVAGTRQGKTVLVELRDAVDPETGERYTVKRYDSEKVGDGDDWRHRRINLKPANPAFSPIVLEGMETDRLRVVAELLRVL